jgi:hypothetical protein
MDHAEVRERLAEAVTEVDWQSRLEAAQGRELREHLAACAACRAEAAAWTRTTEALRAARPFAVERERADSPALPDDLRARTLALVRATGVQRDGIGSGTRPQGTAGDVSTPPQAIGAPGVIRRRAWRRLAVLAAAAAIVLFAGGAAGLQLMGQRDRAEDEVADLTHLTATLDQVLQDPARQVVTLASTTQGSAAGTVAWSGSSGDLVVLSDALAPAPAGEQYRCWIEHNGVRTNVGRMRFSASIAYWAGPLAGWGGPLAHGDRFGVSLTSAAASAGGGDPVRVGTV